MHFILSAVCQRIVSSLLMKYSMQTAGIPPRLETIFPSGISVPFMIF